MRYFVPLILLILLGCEDKTFSRIYKKTIVGKPLTTVSLSETNQTLRSMLIKALQKEHIKVISGANYLLELDGATYPKKCNNPNTSTYDATYNGYFKLTLRKNMHPLYMCQKDYHGTLNHEVIEALLARLKKDLKLTP